MANKTLWKSQGCVPPASNSSPAADAGSSAVYYCHQETGEYCYRPARWCNEGFGPMFIVYNGDANGCDEWGNPNGKTYPESEF